MGNRKHTKRPIDFAQSNRAAAAIVSFLNRRARDRSVGAVDAALALDGLHAVAASLTVVDVLTGTSRHGLGCAVTAFWTRDDGLQFHWTPPHWIRRSGRLVPAVTPDVSDQSRRQRTAAIKSSALVDPCSDKVAFVAAMWALKVFLEAPEARPEMAH